MDSNLTLWRVILHGQRLGYIRVSTPDQHTERPLDLLMSFVRSGDTVIKGVSYLLI
jgi:DNA invertase Pin-like site-specific DNA recombinase